MNLATDIERRCDEAPDRPGLIFEDGREFTYEELDTNASGTARLLEANGVERGERVAIYMQNRPELVFSLIGCWKCGAVPVPINIMYKTEELEKVLDNTSPVVLIASRKNPKVVNKFVDRLNAVYLTGEAPAEGNKRSLNHALAEQSDDHYSAIDVTEDEEAAVLSTGGTTGEPKFVSIAHHGTYESLSKLASANKGGAEPPHGIVPREVPPNLVTLPLFHGGGQQTLLFAYHVGRSVLLMRRFRVNKCVELVDQYGIDNLVLMPTMIYDLLDADTDVTLDSVKSVLSTGQKLDLSLRRRFENRFDIPILENYGATEVGHVAGWTMNDVAKGEWKPGAAGKIYDDVVVEIRDEDDAALPRDEVGEICVQSGMTQDGYVGEGDSELRMEDGWIYTGDMGYVDEDGVLFIVGRKREMIKCGGFQVWPSELEENLLGHEAVDDVCVVGVPDERLGQKPKAFVVPAEAATVDAENLVKYTRERLSHYKAVRAVNFVDALPRTDAGKVKRARLREQHQSESKP